MYIDIVVSITSLYARAKLANSQFKELSKNRGRGDKKGYPVKLDDGFVCNVGLLQILNDISHHLTNKLSVTYRNPVSVTLATSTLFVSLGSWVCART